MSVPASRRKVSDAAYAVKARTVMRETTYVVRRFPQKNLENRHYNGMVLNLASDVCMKAYEADAMYADTLVELERKLMLLNEAYGSLNALSGLADDWLADRPQVYSHPIDASKCALTDRRVISYAGTLMDARKTLVAAIRHWRNEYRKAMEADRELRLHALQALLDGNAGTMPTDAADANGSATGMNAAAGRKHDAPETAKYHHAPDAGIDGMESPDAVNHKGAGGMDGNVGIAGDAGGDTTGGDMPDASSGDDLFSMLAIG